MSNLPSGYQEPCTDPLYEAEFMRSKAERALAVAEAKLARVENLATKWEYTVGGMSTRYAAHRIKAALDGAE